MSNINNINLNEQVSTTWVDDLNFNFNELNNTKIEITGAKATDLVDADSILIQDSEDASLFKTKTFLELYTQMCSICNAPAWSVWIDWLVWIAWYFGGWTGVDFSNVIDWILFADDSAINPAATLSVGRHSLAWVSYFA